MIEKIEDTPLWEKLKNNTLGDSTNLFILVNTKVKLSMSQGYCNLPPIGDQDLEDISEDLSEDSSYNKDDYKTARDNFSDSFNNLPVSFQIPSILHAMGQQTIYKQLLDYYETLSLTYDADYITLCFKDWMNQLPVEILNTSDGSGIQESTQSWDVCMAYVFYISLNLYLLKKENE